MRGSKNGADQQRLHHRYTPRPTLDVLDLQNEAAPQAPSAQIT